ncbi:MAG: hypothetical protein JJ971_08730 [Balneolaceae bacterium]|nr:hypothetical protein [Balneolaceae bacterium]MBO6546675.1 hypothetical protein [Balneolaceae bacterium]MBO6649033.1 hypothetical protein [Balneolaceae bacterium]
MSTQDEFDEFCEHKLQELKQVRFEDLPKFDNNLFTFSKGSRKGTLSIAIEEVREDEILVILQGEIPVRFFSFLSHPFVDGFRKTKKEEVTPASYSDISYYD